MTTVDWDKRPAGMENGSLWLTLGELPDPFSMTLFWHLCSNKILATFIKVPAATRSRLAHALSHAIVRKGDNGRSQPNYSGIIGSFATAGITSFYYPESDRNGGLVIQNALVGIAGRAVGGVFQEFVLRKFTSHATGQTTSRP